MEYNFTEINDVVDRLQNGNSGSGKWKKSSIESFVAYGIVGKTLIAFLVFLLASFDGYKERV